MDQDNRFRAFFFHRIFLIFCRTSGQNEEEKQRDALERRTAPDHKTNIDLSLSVHDLTSYALHLGKARGRFRIHSPFVYELLENVIRDRAPRAAYIPIEKRLEKLRKDGRKIGVKDHGAGSKWAQEKWRKVKDIALRSGSDKRFGRSLFRLAERFAPEYSIELGSSLGIGSMYLAGGSEGKLHSIEACPASASIAKESLNEAGMTNAVIHTGTFQESLPAIMEKIPRLDLMRIDGDHRGEALIQLFEEGLQKAHNDTVFILDDIHWSKDMEEAWRRIQEDERVSLSLDLYHAGLLFLRKEQKDKLHLRIRS